MPNGYDFSDDDDILDEQSKGYQSPVDWSNLNEKAIASALGSLNSKVTACALAISRVFGENDCIRTKDTLNTLLKTDLGQQGWLVTFYETNKGVFSKVNGEGRPEYYSKFSSEEKNKFDTALQYFRDVVYLLQIRASIHQMCVAHFRLVEGFKIDKLAGNLDKAGYNADFYRKINDDVGLITGVLNISWDKLERVASRSEQFLESNRGKLPTSELEKRYRDQRLADYRKFVDISGLSHFLVERSGGLAFSVDPRRLAAMRVIDSYTGEIVSMPDLTDSMQKTIDDCKKIITGDIAEAEKNCTTQAAQFLCAAFQGLTEKIAEFAEWSLEVYRAFKEKRADGPYCWMKKMSALDSVKPKYDFNPSTAEPWDGGTHYWELFTDAAKAIGTQARTFAYEHGADIS